MFTDPIFRIALTISLLGHLAVIVPMRFMASERDIDKMLAVDLNYVVIERPVLVKKEEVYHETGDTGRDAPLKVPDLEVLTGTSMQIVQQRVIDTKDVPENAKKKQEAFLKYYNLIREKIRAEIFKASVKGRKGTVAIKFIVDPDGKLYRVQEAVSDTSAKIRQLTVRGLKRASPFPPFPEELGSRPISFSLTVKFT